jgi:hypothetical protein
MVPVEQFEAEPLECFERLELLSRLAIDFRNALALGEKNRSES